MLNMSNSYLDSLVSSCLAEIKDGNKTAINMDAYMDVMLDNNLRESDLQYPLTINIPRDIDYMLRTKDISPLKTITIEKPFEYNGKPIWNRSTTEGIHLGFGYMNGDRRYMSNFYLGDNSPMSGPHMVVGGMSGGGKSVAMDNLIFNMCYSHSPFDLEIILVDGKITGAARYANTHRIPHVKIVGATEDTSYVISVLEMMDSLMMKRMKLFGAHGYDGIKEFRKLTGIALPRVLILVDEYQLQFKNASSKEAEALKLIYDKYGTAGRSAGVHLLLCSQSYMPELKKVLFHNMPLRACLKCVKETSEGIIENGLASRGVPIGEIYVNNDGARSPEETSMFKIPYLDTEHYVEKGKFLENCGNALSEEFDLTWSLNYYNEDDKLEVNKFETLMDKYAKQDRIVLGTPAFVKKSEIDVAYIEQKYEDLENIGVFSSNKADLKEYMQTLVSNYSKFDVSKVKSYILSADDSLIGDIELPSHIMKFDCDNASLGIYKSTIVTVYRKSIMLSTDKEIFSGEGSIHPQAEEYLEKFLGIYFNGNRNVITELNLKRISSYFEKLNNQTFIKIFKDSAVAQVKDVEFWQQACETLLTLITYSQEYLTKKVDKDNIPVHNYVMVGFDKIGGLTRNEKSIYSGVFKDLLFDSYKTKTNFILVSTLPLPLKSYIDTLGWLFLANVNEATLKLGIEIPKGINRELGLIIKPSTSEFMKIKKLLKFDRN